MKKIILSIIISSLAIITSCKKVIDKKPLDLLTDEDVWQDSKLAQAYLNRLWYATVRTDYQYESWFGLYAGPANFCDFISDNSWSRVARATGGQKNGSAWRDVTANSGAFDNFADIRRVNLAIDRLNDPSTQARLGGSIVVNDMLGQAYFAKGLIYFARARNFGGYPIIDRTLTADDDLNLKRASIKETYDYAIACLEKAIPLLNQPRPAISGRPNKGAAYALLSEVCLHGAAYIKYAMLNGAPAADLNPYYNRSIAAVVSLDALGVYSLEPQASYGRMFNDFAYASGSPSEIILAQFTPPNLILVSNDKAVELACYLTGFGTDLLTDQVRSKYSNVPYSGFVTGFSLGNTEPNPKAVDEAFYIIDLDGKARRWAESQLFAKYVTFSSGVYRLNAQAATDGITDISALMFANRDKRFYTDIAYDGGTYFGNKFDSRIGGNFHVRSFRTLNAGSGAPTGYIYRKGVPETRSWQSADLSGWHKIGLRLSKAYLNAAESAFMLNDFATARSYINKTRTVHGGLPALISESGEELWKIYMDERNAELILENDRYFTLMRSGIRAGAEDIPELNFGEIKQFEVAADGRSYQYVPLLFEAANNTYSWTRHRYLLPVPKAVTDANPNYLPNNPRY